MGENEGPGKRVLKDALENEDNNGRAVSDIEDDAVQINQNEDTKSQNGSREDEPGESSANENVRRNNEIVKFESVYKQKTSSDWTNPLVVPHVSKHPEDENGSFIPKDQTGNESRAVEKYTTVNISKDLKEQKRLDLTEKQNVTFWDEVELNKPGPSWRSMKRTSIASGRIQNDSAQDGTDKIDTADERPNSMKGEIIHNSQKGYSTSGSSETSTGHNQMDKFVQVGPQELQQSSLLVDHMLRYSWETDEVSQRDSSIGRRSCCDSFIRKILPQTSHFCWCRDIDLRSSVLYIAYALCVMYSVLLLVNFVILSGSVDLGEEESFFEHFLDPLILGALYTSSWVLCVVLIIGVHNDAPEIAKVWLIINLVATPVGITYYVLKSVVRFALGEEEYPYFVATFIMYTFFYGLVVYFMVIVKSYYVEQEDEEAERRISFQPKFSISSNHSPFQRVPYSSPSPTRFDRGSVSQKSA